MVTALARVRDLEPYEIELEEKGCAFLPAEAVIRATQHELWLFYLYVGGCDSAQVAYDFPLDGWHIRVQNAPPQVGDG